MGPILGTLLLAGGCGTADNGDEDVAAGEQAVNAAPQAIHARGVMPKGSHEQGGGDVVNLSQPGQAAPTGAHLSYYGGRVVSNMQVVQVIYGTGSYLSQVTSTSSPSMATFYQGVLNSPYVDWLSEYNTSGNASTPSQVIGRGSFSTQVTITPSAANNGSTIDDSNIQAELSAQIAAGNLPAPTHDANGNNNTYYAVFFPHGKTITLSGYSSCSAFCAYHGTIANAGGHGEVYYGVHPDMQTGSGCETGCGAASTAFGNYTQVASHEMIETITDPEIGLTPTIQAPIAWYDYSTTYSINSEIGDLCNDQHATVVGSDGVTYDVQNEFSNAANLCIVSKVPATHFGSTQTWWSSAFYGSSTLIGDVNGDHRADLVALGSGYVGVIESTGTLNNNFGSYQTWLGSTFTGTHGTFLGDINGDGKADLVALNNTNVTAILSSGSAFGSTQTWWSNAFYGAYGTFLADVNGDKKADLVALGSGYVGVILSTGSAFGAYQTWLGSTFTGTHGTLLGDVDGDGKADLIALNDTSVTVRRSTGSGFGAVETWWSSGFWGAPTFVGDVDGDGKADLVAMGSGYVGVILSTGSAFGSYQTWLGSTFTGTHGTLFGDLDADGRADVVDLNNSNVTAILATP
jgi:hypothetical protein